MDRTDISKQIISFIETEFPSPGFTLTDSTNLLEEWFIDSLGIIETVLFLERQFGITLSRADINGTNFKDVNALSDFVCTRLSL